MRISDLERKLKEEMKLNETFLLEAAQMLKMAEIFLMLTWALASLSYSSVFGFEEKSFVDRKNRQVGMKLRWAIKRKHISLLNCWNAPWREAKWKFWTRDARNKRSSKLAVSWGRGAACPLASTDWFFLSSLVSTTPTAL